MSENQLYFAPMEGITGSIYRRAHHRIFGGVDRYYAPFIFTNPKGKISKKDLSLVHEAVTEDEISRIVSRWTGIPVAKLTASEKSKTLNLAD